MPVPCDIILTNGKVVTVDPRFSIAEAVAVSGDRILAVGAEKEMGALAGPNTRKIDLEGKTVVPGFIDTHPHMIHNALGLGSSTSIAGLSSIEDIQAAIAEKASGTPPGEWIVTSAVGEPPYYFNLPGMLKEKRWPNRWDLDEAAPEHPVYISAAHCRVPNTGVLNTRGLSLSAIDGNTPSETGGVGIVKDPGSGEPTGELNGMHRIYNRSPIFNALMSRLPRPGFEDLAKGFELAVRMRHAAGMTAVYEGHYVDEDQLRLCSALQKAGRLKMRIAFAHELDVTLDEADLQKRIEALKAPRDEGRGADWLRVSGATVSVDGPIWHGLALMKRPYLGPYGNKTSGVQMVTAEKFKGIALHCARHGVRLNSCFGGDRSADVTLDAFEAADREVGIKDQQWVVQHIQFPDQDQVHRCRDLGLSVTTCTNFEWGKGTEVYVERLGEDYAAKAMPLRRWLDAGVEIAQGTDYGPYAPMFTLWQSLKRIHALTGRSYAGPDQAVSREEALRMYTIYAAQALLWEDRLGSLEPGKLADLVVLDRDVLTCPLDEIKDARVLMTLIGGERVYEAP